MVIVKPLLCMVIRVHCLLSSPTCVVAGRQKFGTELLNGDRNCSAVGIIIHSSIVGM